MRLSFASGERADFIVDGPLSLGSAEDNGLPLPAPEVAPYHAQLSVDARGIVLDVLQPGVPTHVNARPVRERALLRQGDVLSLGQVVMRLKPDRDDAIRVPPPDATTLQEPTEPAGVVLRAVSGSHFGRAFPINPSLLVGRGEGCALNIDEPDIAAHHATLELAGQVIYLRHAEGVNGVRVNGVEVSSAILHGGDQITLGHAQFVVEAPGLPRRDQWAAAAAGLAHGGDEAVGAGQAGHLPEEPRPHGAGPWWWLVAAAAAIAAASVWLLQHGI